MRILDPYSKRFIFVVLFIFSFSSHANQPDADCVSWFKASKVKAGTKGCELGCATLMTDKGTFMCPNQCDLLCKENDKLSPLGKFLYYPGLTPAERKLTEKYPTETFTVFVQKTRAEWSSGRNFPDQGI